MAGDSVFNFFRSSLAKHFKRRFKVILPNALNITKLRGDYALRDVDKLDEVTLGYHEDDNFGRLDDFGDEVVNEVKPRNKYNSKS